MRGWGEGGEAFWTKENGDGDGFSVTIPRSASGAVF